MSGTITNAEKEKEKEQEQEQEIAGGKQDDAESCMQDQEPNDSEKNIDENLMQPSSQQEVPRPASSYLIVNLRP